MDEWCPALLANSKFLDEYVTVPVHVYMNKEPNWFCIYVQSNQRVILHDVVHNIFSPYFYDGSTIISINYFLDTGGKKYMVESDTMIRN